MAKHRRQSGWYFPRITTSQALAALAGDDMLIGSSLGNVSDSAYVSSAELSWSRANGTVGEGPIIVGLAHSDYSANEIEEWFESTNTWDLGNQVSQEHARRKCRIVGTFSGDNVTEVLNDGKPIKTKLGFVCHDGTGLVQFAYNDSGAALTTGSLVKINGKFNVRRI